MPTPKIRQRGIFKLRAPWDTDMGGAITYSVEGISTFREAAVRDGIDVLNDIYVKKGLTVSEFEQDRLSKANIITFMSPGRPDVLVPDTYIEKLPDYGGRDYERCVISCSLGAIPKELVDSPEMDELMQHIRFGVQKLLNVNHLVTLNIAPSTGSVTEKDHADSEANRTSGIAGYITDKTANLKLVREVAEASDTLKAFGGVLKDKGLFS